MRANGRAGRAAAALVTCILAMSLCLAAAAADGTKDRTEIRVGWYAVDGLQDMDAAGRASGYDYEYLKAIAQYTDWRYTFVTGTWNECLERLKAGEIDLLGGVSWSEERAAQVLFGDVPAGTGGSRLICRASDDRFDYEDYTALDGMTVGTVSGSERAAKFEKLCAAHGVSVHIRETAGQEELFSLLDEGKLDLALTAQARSIDNCRVVLDFDPQSFYFAAAPGRQELLDELNRAMGRIRAGDPGFDEALREKYFNGVSGLTPSFTREEKAYIAAHPTLTVVYDPVWQPLEYLDAATGTMGGMMGAVFEDIAGSTGFTFDFVTAESFDAAKSEYSGKAQLFSSLSCDYDWGDQLGYRLTQPLFDMQVMQIYTGQQDGVIALPDGYYITQAVRRRYGDAFEYRLYPTVAGCVEAVFRGEAGSTFVNGYELNYYMSFPRYTNLKFRTVNGFFQKLSVAVSADEDQLLFSIINKAVCSLSEEELTKIVSENSSLQHKNSLGDLVYTNPIQVLLLSVILTFAIVYAVGRIRAERRKREELSDLNVRLTRANAAKSEFLSRMSHDIRTPMNGIIGMTRIAREQSNPPRTDDCLEKIDYSSRYLLGLINDVLDMTKIESGELRLHPEPYAPEEFFRYVESVIRPLCEAKDQTLRVVRSTDPVFVPLLDKLRFNQIAFNLLSNAVKYTPVGGTITFRLEETARDGRMELVVGVDDDGIGMSREFQEVLFEPYRQEERAQGAGTGLGLAIVRRIVDLMGGTISVESRVDEGSRFTMRCVVDCVRAEENPPPAPSEDADAEWLPLAGKRALLCEDNALNQEIACSILERVGIRAERASNGREGVERFSAAPAGAFDYILMDIRMPVMDGLEAARAIRALDRPDARTIPIIALTANAYDEDVRATREAGMDAHLAKPLEPGTLYGVLKRFAGGAGTRRREETT